MSPAPDNLASLKDDMVAFIEGHGMRRFHGYVDYEEVQSVIWKTEDNPDSWKDFVELAKAAAAPFLTMDSWTLRREELDQMVERLGNLEFTSDEDVEEADSVAAVGAEASWGEGRGEPDLNGVGGEGDAIDENRPPLSGTGHSRDRFYGPSGP